MEEKNTKKVLSNNNQILRGLVHNFDAVFNKYSYLRYDMKTRLKIVNMAIKKSRLIYDGSIPYENYLCKLICSFLENQTKNYFVIVIKRLFY